MIEKVETVRRTVTIELPKDVDDFLDAFAKFVGVPLEENFREDLENSIQGYYHSEAFSSYIRRALKNYGVGWFFEVEKEDC